MVFIQAIEKSDFRNDQRTEIKKFFYFHSESIFQEASSVTSLELNEDISINGKISLTAKHSNN